MPSVAKSLLPLGLVLGAAHAGGGPDHVKVPVTEYVTTTSCVTVYETKTIPVTQYVDVVVPVTKTTTALAWTTWTKVKTVVEHHTLSLTNTVTNTVTNTDTALVTVTNTASTTKTNTESTTKTVPTTTSTTLTVPTTTSTTLTVPTTTSTTSTVPTTTSTTTTVPTTTSTTLTVPTTTSTTRTVPTTTSTTETIFSTTFDPCPKSCTVSAETVNLYFWPTNRPYTYPTTHVHPTHSYTFTYPSVYMFIPSAVATNTLGQPAGPATTSWMLPLRLHQVSTIVQGTNITRQLTLSDLGTDCPQTADPTGIASLVDSRCNPVLAAPNEVKSWAWPCNACGRFGLFDPPYAVPTLTGRLVEPTTVPVSTITAAPVPSVSVVPTTAVAPVTPIVTTPAVTATPPPVTAGAAGLQPFGGLSVVVAAVITWLLL